MNETARPGTPRSSGYRRRLLVQILAMATVALGTGGIILSLQFQSAVEGEAARLTEISRSRARLIEVIILHEIQAPGLDPDSEVPPLALSQLSDAQLAFSGFGATGEFTFAERVGDSIHFLLHLRHEGPGSLLTLPMDSDLAEPMRRALAGERGTLRGPDYRGVEVLAAYEPVRVEGLTLGLVAKVDYSEFRRPLIANGFKAALFALLLIGLGAYLISRVGNPLIRALEGSEKRYRQFFEDSPEAILITRPDGTVLECNAAAGHLFRTSVEEVVGTNARDFYQDPEQRAEMMGVLRAEGQVRGMELDLIRPDGSTFVCLITAHFRGGIGGEDETLEVVLTEISELRTAQEARIESEGRLRALYESVQAGVVLQAASGEILHANSIASEILGMQAEEVEGRDSMDPTWEMIDEEGNPVPGEDHPAMITLRTGVPIRGAVRGLFSGDPDRTKWLIINTEPVRVGAAGEVEEVASTFLDITEFEEADKALRESQERAQQYLDVAEVMLVALDTEGRIEMINRKGCEILGYEVADLLGKNWMESCLPEGTVPMVQKGFSQIIGGEVGPLEYLENAILTSSGDERIMAWHNALLLGPGGEIRGVLSSGEDITARKWAEKALAESEARFRALFEEAPVAYQSLDGEGRFLDVNDAFVSLLGHERKDLIGSSFETILNSESKQLFRERFPLFKASGIAKGSELTVRRRDGSERLVSIEGRVSRTGAGQFRRTHCVLTDITERRRAEEDLRTAEGWVSGILSAAPVGIGVVRDRVFQTVNDFFCGMLGYDREELVGVSAALVYPSPEEFERVGREKYAAIAQTGIGAVETRFRRKNGEEIRVILSSTFLDSSDPSKGSVFTALDITAEAMAREALRESERRFRLLFEDSPIAIWEEDFSAVKNRLAELRTAGVADLRPYLEEHQEEVEKLASLVRVLGINQASLSIFGVSSKEELLRDISWHFTEESFHAFREELGTLDGGRTHFEFETPIRDGSGLSKSLLMSLRVFPGSEESWERVLVSFIDITKRKKAEEATREALAWQRATIEGSGDAIFISDSEARLVLVNRAASELTGYSREQLMEMTIPNLHADVDLEAFRLHFDEIMAGTAAFTEAPILRADGTKVDTEFNNRRLEVGGSPYMHTVARDLTERREMERALQKSEESFRQLFNEMQEGFAVHEMLWDEAGKAVDYRFLSVNPAFERITGLDREEILGKTAREVLPGLEPIWIERYGKVARSGDETSFEAESADLGRHFHASVFSPERGQFAVTFSDITDRVDAERLRKENEARLKLAQQVGRVGLLDRDLVRDVEVWSDTTYEILGLNPEDVEPGPSAWLNSIHPDDRLKATRFLGQLLHGEDSKGEEYRVVHPNGEVRWVRGVARVFLNPEGSSVIRILATVQDITSERAALDAVEASEARLRALAARLAKVREEERTSISRELHDEVGQTLTGLRMDLSMERSELPVEAVGQRERFTRLIENTDANIDFIRELSSRLRPPILDVMGLGPALEWQVDEHRARTKVRFHLDLPEGGPLLPSEEGISLYRIAQEALTNIFRHAGASNVWVSLREEVASLSLMVEDDGVGVPVERAGLPTSLGLLGMTERAMAISGDLVIEPREEGGTRVRVTLPFPIPISIPIPIPGPSPGPGPIPGQEGELP